MRWCPTIADCAGLGHAFLRHVERTGSTSTAHRADPAWDYLRESFARTIRVSSRMWVAFNKVDLPAAEWPAFGGRHRGRRGAAGAEGLDQDEDRTRSQLAAAAEAVGVSSTQSRRATGCPSSHGDAPSGSRIERIAAQTSFY